MNNDDLDDDFDNDDFDLDDLDSDGFSDLDGQSSLADIWKNNPAVKIVVIAAGALLLLAGVIFVGGNDKAVAPSRVGTGSNVSELAGTNVVSPSMEEALHEENNRRVEEARRTGGSVITMPVDPMRGQLPMQFEEEEAEDPLERWRQMQEDRLRNSQVSDRAVEQPAPVEVDTRTPAVNALSEAMATQMQAILNNQGISSMKVKQVSPEDYLVRLQREDEERRARELAEQLELQKDQISIDETTAVVLVPAGTIEYAQMVTEANTDAPGPILAQIASGPLKGARLIGSFSSTDDYLTLNFNTVVLDGISYGVSAVALDPDTTLPGVATDVDRRYLQRVALPAAAAFITGLTEAIAQSGTTTITVPDSSGSGGTISQQNSDLNSDQEVSSGLAEAGQEVGDILDDMADDIEPLIRVRAGTPIGILFTAPVFDQPVTADSAS